MANVRFSLPSQLIEPIPNLEYWNYIERPDYFARSRNLVIVEVRLTW